MEADGRCEIGSRRKVRNGDSRSGKREWHISGTNASVDYIIVGCYLVDIAFAESAKETRFTDPN